jgi:hypothetical protein
MGGMEIFGGREGILNESDVAKLNGLKTAERES